MSIPLRKLFQQNYVIGRKPITQRIRLQTQILKTPPDSESKLLLREPKRPKSFLKDAPKPPSIKVKTPTQIEAELTKREGIKIRLGDETIKKLFSIRLPKKDTTGKIMKDDEGKVIFEEKSVGLSEGLASILGIADEIIDWRRVSGSTLDTLTALMLSQVDDVADSTNILAQQYKDKLKHIPIPWNTRELGLTGAIDDEFFNGAVINKEYLLNNPTRMNLIKFYLYKYGNIPTLFGNTVLVDDNTPITLAQFINDPDLNAIDLLSGFVYPTVANAIGAVRNRVVVNAVNARQRLESETGSILRAEEKDEKEFKGDEPPTPESLHIPGVVRSAEEGSTAFVSIIERSKAEAFAALKDDSRKRGFIAGLTEQLGRKPTPAEAFDALPPQIQKEAREDLQRIRTLRSGDLRSVSQPRSVGVESKSEPFDLETLSGIDLSVSSFGSPISLTPAGSEIFGPQSSFDLLISEADELLAPTSRFQPAGSEIFSPRSSTVDIDSLIRETDELLARQPGSGLQLGPMFGQGGKRNRKKNIRTFGRPPTFRGGEINRVKLHGSTN